MTEWQNTQRVDDFKVGQKVIVRSDSPWVRRQDKLTAGDVYTVADVRVANHARGSGELLLEERDDGEFHGRFGHLLFDHHVDTPRPFKVGDRIIQTGPHYYANDVTHFEYHESPNGVGSTGVINSLDTAKAPHNVCVVWDGNGIDSIIGTDCIALLDDVRTVDAPDLSDAEVRKGLPMMEAYPVGSVWNHIATGEEPVTITGPDPDEDGRVMVHVPLYHGQAPYEGSWIRGALDTYGTLVSLPGGGEQKSAVTMADLEALQGAERDKALAEKVEMIKRLEAERSALTLAASDERRRLCAEIDALRVERDTLRDERDAATETRNQIAADRAEKGAEVNDLKARLAASEKRSDEGWARAAKQAAMLDFVRLDFLSDSDIDKLEGFESGWHARSKA